ncbi:uncharacterized protein [Physcomitrium patens]|uniref:uncharacterized protein n=1 Tax=Physcomitrium patens TaxID=3218 RepID=UPI003CCDF320
MSPLQPASQSVSPLSSSIHFSLHESVSQSIHESMTMVSPLVGGGRWEGGEGNTWKGNLLLDLYFKLIGFLGMESECRNIHCSTFKRLVVAGTEDRLAATAAKSWLAWTLQDQGGRHERAREGGLSTWRAMLMMDASRFLSRFAERQRHSLVECDTFRSFNFLSYSSLAITIPVPESRLESICCNEGGSTCSRVISFASSLGRTIIHPDLRFECTLQEGGGGRKALRALELRAEAAQGVLCEVPRDSWLQSSFTAALSTSC